MYQRYGESPDEEVVKRLDYELSVIIKMGYTDYYLIVWDFIKYARDHNVPVGPGRGSGAGSLCAYCIGITGIDPLKYGLLFERFLNPERVSMPDFDIDFCIEGRQSIKDYVVEKYGKDYVSEIIAFDTLKARAAVRDVGRVLSIPYQLCDKVAKLIDPKLDLNESIKHSEELEQLYRSDRTVRELIDLSKKLEGMPRHASTHAAGVVISAVPLSELVPLQKNDDTVVTQYTMTILESLGLLKMDFLGLRNLTIIRDTVNEIRKTDPEFDISAIPTDDADVYNMVAHGDTAGVFQFESEGITQRLIDLKPERLEDLIVVMSLYRPGPMKSIPEYIENKKHPDRIKYKHPLLENILKDTYGIMVYQEQVMEICRKLAGYSYGHADIVRRAMAKKKHDVMLKERESFVSGAVANGVPEDTANLIFDDMISFASYAFNKSHAAAYSYLSYQTAYLKYHYRGIYMACLMSSVMSVTSKLTEYINICKSAGIEIVRPDINKSMSNFAYTGGKMYFGLLAIKNIGSGLAEKIIKERNIHGKFNGLQDFCERMNVRELNKKALENLICSGAFDGLGLNRRQMLDNYEMILESAASGTRGVIEGQLNLLDAFGAQDDMNIKIPYAPEYDTRRLLAMEKEAAGMYLTGDPLSEFSYLTELMHTKFIKDINSLNGVKDGDEVRVLCTMQSNKIHITKKNEKMAFITIEDSTGELEGVVFPDLYAVSASRLKEGAILMVKGKISVKDESVTIVCGSVLAENDFNRNFSNMKLCIKTTSADTKIDELKRVCSDFRGDTAICFYFTDVRKMLMPKMRLSIEISSDSYRKITEIFNSKDVGLIQ